MSRASCATTKLRPHKFHSPWSGEASASSGPPLGCSWSQSSSARRWSFCDWNTLGHLRQLALRLPGRPFRLLVESNCLAANLRRPRMAAARPLGSVEKLSPWPSPPPPPPLSLGAGLQQLKWQRQQKQLSLAAAKTRRHSCCAILLKFACFLLLLLLLLLPHARK